MLGHGKLCRFQIHHPMSLGDVLAALFFGKLRQARPRQAQAIPGDEMKPGTSGRKPADSAQTNQNRKPVETARVLVK